MQVKKWCFAYILYVLLGPARALMCKSKSAFLLSKLYAFMGAAGVLKCRLKSAFLLSILYVLLGATRLLYNLFLYSSLPFNTTLTLS